MSVAKTHIHDTLQQMFELADPYLGSVADQPVPGKPGFSRFRRLDADLSLYYNLGNNAVSASVTPRGAIHRAQIFTGLCEARVAHLPGVWHGYHYINFCQDLTFALRLGDAVTEIAAQGLRQDTTLILGAFPLTRVRIGELDVRQFVMAPLHEGQRLRALLIGLYIETCAEVAGALVIPPARRGQAYGSHDPAGFAEFVLLDGWELTAEGCAFVARAGEPAYIPTLWVMAQDRDEFERNREQAATLDSQKLIVETLDHFAGKGGEFRVADMLPGIGALYRRAIHAQLITPFRDRDGQPLGSSWGSDASECDENYIWMMDTFYNYLSAGLFAPELLLDGVRFFCFRSLPGAKAKAFWRAAGKLPPNDGCTHSLGNAVAPIVLAGRYYDLTGDGAILREWTAQDPDSGAEVALDARFERLLADLLATRQADEPHLFRSQWLSDGPARGTYHTGSNMLAWYALRVAARLFGEVFDKESQAAQYAAFAARMREDIYRHCTIVHRGQAMFNEGAETPPLHDGEESGSTIAPCLGFCEPDDPLLLRYKRFSCTPDNPLWDAVAEGIRWGDEAITMPGFISQLAAADFDAALSATLHKLCGLADVDGEWWWWPMRPGSREVLRAHKVGKCGWATGVFLLHFVHTLLGVRWDAPTRRLTLKPFVPWDNYRYAGLRLGSLELDIAYENTGARAAVRIRHNQERLDEIKIVLMAPIRKAHRVLRASPPCAVREGEPFYNRPTREIAFTDLTDAEIVVELAWEPRLDSLGGTDNG